MLNELPGGNRNINGDAPTLKFKMRSPSTATKDFTSIAQSRQSKFKLLSDQIDRVLDEEQGYIKK